MDYVSFIHENTFLHCRTQAVLVISHPHRSFYSYNKLPEKAPDQLHPLIYELQNNQALGEGTHQQRLSYMTLNTPAGVHPRHIYDY